MNIRWRSMGTLALLGGSIGLGCREETEDTSVRVTLDTDTTGIAAVSDLGLDQAFPAGAEALLATWPNDLPPYFRESYLAAMHAPLPTVIAKQVTPAVIPQLQYDRNVAGYLGSFQPAGPTVTATNAFFQPLGTNGRTCFTCHQTQDGMGLSLATVRKVFDRTAGNDPLFAPVDGANCPNQVPRKWPPSSPAGYTTAMKQFTDSHSLLLTKGLIRIPIAIPRDAEYTIEVVSDPTTCNNDPTYNTSSSGNRIVSVFRRPVIASNLNFKTNTLDFAPGSSPFTNIMSDGREPTLFTQAIDATLGHAQATRIPTQEQLNQIVAFETGIFSAQACDDRAEKLDQNGATGGPTFLANHGKDAPGFGPSVFDEFDAWKAATGQGAAHKQAIARGQAIFHGRGGEGGTRGQFTLAGVAGFNDFPGLPPALPGSSCATCHNFAHAGSDILARSQRDIGTGGHATSAGGQALANDQPIFKLTCPKGSFLFDPELTTVYSNDPAKALITGKCRDIGTRTVPSLRGLASRDPYFSNGGAASLIELVDVYDRRFSIGLTQAEKFDLISFLASL